MPPQISEDEASVSSEQGYEMPVREEKPVKEENKSKNKAKAEEEVDEEPLMVESEPEEEDDDEIGEGEYVVEKITNHLVDEETGELKFEIKWEGYSKKSDRTWEPEENLETAQKLLNEYLAKFGGKEAILAAVEEKKLEGPKKGKKRGRASTGADNGTTNGTSKRGKKSAQSSPTPASFAKAEFKPPTGSWEEEVVAIDACEGSEGTVVVYLTWVGGQKTQHPLAQVYKRCPQKMLAFYESHLVFKKNDEA